jgi:hypothetical protein
LESLKTEVNQLDDKKLKNTTILKTHEASKELYRELMQGVQRLTDRCDDYKTLLDERLTPSYEYVIINTNIV